MTQQELEPFSRPHDKVKWNTAKKKGAILENNHKFRHYSPAETRSHCLLLIANVVSLLLRAHPWLSISQPQISANIKHQDRGGGGSSPNHCSILRTKRSSHREKTAAKQPPDFSPHWKETNKKKPFSSIYKACLLPGVSGDVSLSSIKYSK